MIEQITLENARRLLPARPDGSHKGTFGHVFLLAGSRGFTGAARLACEAAARSGAGLVTLGIPAPLADIAAITLMETMTLPLPATREQSFSREALGRALDFAEKKQAVVIGPGLSRHPDTAAFAREFIQQCPAPMVADADALNAFEDNLAALEHRESPLIVTPHPGEMARLTGKPASAIQSEREHTARAFAETHRITVALKGRHTVCAATDGRLAVNTTGNHGLATGGTGDVLTGLMGGLLAQGMAPFDAACLAVFVHGLAADIAARKGSARALVASELLHTLHAAWRIVEEDTQWIV